MIEPPVKRQTLFGGSKKWYHIHHTVSKRLKTPHEIPVREPAALIKNFDIHKVPSHSPILSLALTSAFSCGAGSPPGLR